MNHSSKKLRKHKLTPYSSFSSWYKSDLHRKYSFLKYNSDKLNQQVLINWKRLPTKERQLYKKEAKTDRPKRTTLKPFAIPTSKNRSSKKTSSLTHFVQVLQTTCDFVHKRMCPKISNSCPWYIFNRVLRAVTHQMQNASSKFHQMQNASCKFGNKYLRFHHKAKQYEQRMKALKNIQSAQLRIVNEKNQSLLNYENQSEQSNIYLKTTLDGNIKMTEDGVKENVLLPKDAAFPQGNVEINGNAVETIKEETYNKNNNNNSIYNPHTTKSSWPSFAFLPSFSSLTNSVASKLLFTSSNKKPKSDLDETIKEAAGNKNIYITENCGNTSTDNGKDYLRKEQSNSFKQTEVEHVVKTDNAMNFTQSEFEICNMTNPKTALEEDNMDDIKSSETDDLSGNISYSTTGSNTIVNSIENDSLNNEDRYSLNLKESDIFQNINGKVSFSTYKISSDRDNLYKPTCKSIYKYISETESNMSGSIESDSCDEMEYSYSTTDCTDSDMSIASVTESEESDTSDFLEDDSFSYYK